MSKAPYNTKSGARVRNDRDGIFRQGGRQLIMAVAENGSGYKGTFDIGMTV